MKSVRKWWVQPCQVQETATSCAYQRRWILLDWQLPAKILLSMWPTLWPSANTTPTRTKGLSSRTGTNLEWRTSSLCASYTTRRSSRCLMTLVGSHAWTFASCPATERASNTSWSRYPRRTKCRWFPSCLSICAVSRPERTSTAPKSQQPTLTPRSRSESFSWSIRPWMVWPMTTTKRSTMTTW